MASLNHFISFISILFFTLWNTATPAISSNFSTILVFGDSTMDTGNNNYIHTVLKANFFPYGLDFPGHTATGRFSNGKLIPDFLASFFKIKELVPPFLDPNLPDDDIKTGVVFASAGSGYDDLTTVATKVIPVLSEVQLFKDYIGRLKGIVGEEEAEKRINGALVLISAGTNDFNLNFYDLPTRRSQFSISGYEDFLQNRLQTFVKELYDLGCRNMVIAGVPPIGCLPIQMSLKFEKPIDRKCLEDQNSDSRAYNQKLVALLPTIQAQLPGSKIIYSDVYNPVIDMINHPQTYGFVETKVGCCGTGLVETGPFCNLATPVCPNTSQYMFWDSIHPTEAVYKFLSEKLFNDLSSKLA